MSELSFFFWDFLDSDSVGAEKISWINPNLERISFHTILQTKQKQSITCSTNIGALTDEDKYNNYDDTKNGKRHTDDLFLNVWHLGTRGNVYSLSVQSNTYLTLLSFFGMPHLFLWLNVTHVISGSGLVCITMEGSDVSKSDSEDAEYIPEGRLSDFQVKLLYFYLERILGVIGDRLFTNILFVDSVVYLRSWFFCRRSNIEWSIGRRGGRKQGAWIEQVGVACFGSMVYKVVWFV